MFVETLASLLWIILLIAVLCPIMAAIFFALGGICALARRLFVQIIGCILILIAWIVSIADGFAWLALITSIVCNIVIYWVSKSG